MTTQHNNAVRDGVGHEGEVNDELIYSDDDARVSRRTIPGVGRVIVKQAIGMQAIQRLNHEVSILKRLVDVAGVTHLADAVAEPNTLLLNDDGGVSLSEFMRAGALTVAQVVELACVMASTLASVHKAGVIHRDICPDNILINVVTRQPTLIDFNIASLLNEHTADTKGEMAGTLAYMSPEQTGRTGRAADQRSDLYSLGITLYELLTRRRPFVSNDLLELVHDHLVRIPDAPNTVNTGVPNIVSDVIMRLLEKEPDKRYQSAAGLVHDLQLISAGMDRGQSEPFALGQFDFGARLQPPAKLIGRDRELAMLRDALTRTGAGRHPCLLMAGAAGVGKSALLAELKSIATANKALCVVGAFDQYKQDSANAALEIFQSLGRQLLANNEELLARQRNAIRDALGNNLGIGPSALPEFKMLLGEVPSVEITDANEAEARTAQASLAILRVLSSAENQLVVLLDDMQWAPQVSLRMLDAIVTSSDSLPGLLVVCSYRQSDAGSASPLEAQIERWKLIELAPPEIQVDCLSAEAATEFAASMLRLPPEAARQLSPVLAERTGNNPYNLVEVINALRQDGLLVPAKGEWQWDAAEIRRHVGNTSVADLLSRRVGKLPAAACELLQMVACLGGDVDLNVLAMASGLDVSEAQRHLAASTEDGLLVLVRGNDNDVVRFCNGRVQEAVIEGMQADVRASMHLALARRIGERIHEQAEYAAFAAEQYLPGADLIEAVTERRMVVALFERNAKRLRLLNGGVAQKFLAAAVKLLKSIETPDDNAQLFTLECELHRALFGLGKLEEVDDLWESINRRAPTAESLAEPTRIQMYSLNSRRRFADSMNMGLALLSKIGFEKPADIRPAVAAGLKRMAQFSAGDEKQKDFDCPEATDPRVILLSNIVPHTTTPAYYADPAVWAWLSLEAQGLWMQYGPARLLLSGLCSGPPLLVGMMQDYRNAFALSQHIIAVGDHRGYQPSVSYARTMSAISASHWFEPLEATVAHFRRSLHDLISLGDESFFLSNFVSFDPLFDYSPTLDVPLTELELGFSHANRIRQLDFQQRYRPRKQMVFALRGETKMPGSLEDADFDEAKFLASIDQTSVTGWVFHVVSAMTALIFGDLEKMGRHTATAMPLSGRAPGYYLNANLRLMQGIALCERARGLPETERVVVLEEFDKTCLQWMTARAVDAPMNYLHLQKWLEAERAWASQSIWQAGIAFDTALSEAAEHQRPWHRAALAERAARFHLYSGLEQSGRALMIQAFELYTSWGAVGKVKELLRQHSFLRNTGRSKSESTVSGTMRGTMVDTDMVDMMAVLRASQALSSETSLVSLTAQVGKVLGAITGATSVQLIVKGEDGSGTWVLASSLANGAMPITVEQAGEKGDVPFTVFRYAERIGEVLVIEDVVRDDRFSSDPYAQKHDQCSLMLVPILKQGQLNGMLVLANTQRRGAFSADRLDSVAMIAGQLSVSLDNALLYASLEKRVAERTAQLRQKTNDINAMLQNMPQGVLTVIRGGVIHPEYSAYLETILETTDIANCNVMERVFGSTSLGADTLSQVDAAIGSCIGEDEMNFEFNSHLLVAEFDLHLPGDRIKSLALSWSPISDDQGLVDKLMLCVRDVTELKRLEAEANTRKRELQMIGEILAVSQEKFHEFIDSARAFADENKKLIEQTVDKQLKTIDLLFRNMHTIKGNARTYGLLGLTNLVHVAEQSYDDLRKHEEAPWNSAQLLIELATVKTAIEKYSQVNDTVLGRKGPGRRASVEKFLMVEKQTVENAMQLLKTVDETDSVALRSALASIGSTLNLIGTQPLRDILAGTLDSLPSLAKELGRAAPVVVIEDHGIVIRTQASGMLRNLFTHLLRNSVDHGIERPDERTEKGKGAAGHIVLQLELDSDSLQIRLHDDGRGLPIAKIRQRALEQQLIASAATSSEQVAQLIFRSGFSTAEQVTEVSGRGVGMDAVRGFLEKEGGSIAIRFLDDDEQADYRPFATVITLPIKFAASASAAMSFAALRNRA